MMPRLKAILASRPVRHLTGTDRISSAVLIPVYRRDDEFYVAFIQRTDRVSTHKGQISFPGGSRDPQDKSLAETALRECAEEIGVAPDSVDLIGELDDFPTHVSYYIISPFVGVIPWPYPFRADAWETEEIIEVPVSTLLDGHCRTEASETVDGEHVTTYFYTYQGRTIWGATARILHQFLELWEEAARTLS
jgi:8-oxo-dGTP pyrophosphatase MutT (NUDIX family)